MSEYAIDWFDGDDSLGRSRRERRRRGEEPIDSHLPQTEPSVPTAEEGYQRNTMRMRFGRRSEKIGEDPRVSEADISIAGLDHAANNATDPSESLEDNN